VLPPFVGHADVVALLVKIVRRCVIGNHVFKNISVLFGTLFCLLHVHTWSQSYVLGSNALGKAFFNAEENIVVFKTRKATRGVVNHERTIGMT
jgi:hypothetical protein